MAINPDTGYDDSSLEGILGNQGGLGGIQGANLGNIANFLRGSGAPEGYDWTNAINQTAINQRDQFGGWSTFDDPGQVASKVLGNISDPWAVQGRAQLLGSSGFASSQAQGAKDWDASQADPSFLGIDNSAWTAIGLLAGGAGAAGAFGGAAAGGDAALSGGGSGALGADASGFASGAGGLSEDAMLQAAREAQLGTLAGNGVSASPSIWTQLLDGLKLPTGGAGAGSGSTLGRLFNIGTGLYGIKQSYDTKKLASQIMSQSDPLMADRAGYAGQLKSLIADPSGIINAPEYKAGEQAIMRRMASQGYIGSGNMMKSLQDFGGNLYDQQVARLQSLATNGAGAGSAVGANLTGSSNAALISALNRIGYGVGGGF